MAIIEGVGDEVVACFGFMLVILILILAWVSTNVTDRHLISVIVVDSRSFQRLVHRIAGLTHRQLGQLAAAAGRPVGADAGDNNGDDSQNNETDEPPEERADDSPEAENIPEQSQEGAEPQSSAPVNEPDDHIDNDADVQAMGSINAESLMTEDSVPSADQTEHAEGPVGTDPTYTTPDSEGELRQRRLNFFDKIQGDNKSDEACAHQSESATCTQSESTPVTEQPQPAAADAGAAQSEAEADAQPLEGHIRIRIKYLDERQRLVQAKPEDTVGEFKR